MCPLTSKIYIYINSEHNCNYKCCIPLVESTFRFHSPSESCSFTLTQIQTQVQYVQLNDRNLLSWLPKSPVTFFSNKMKTRLVSMQNIFLLSGFNPKQEPMSSVTHKVKLQISEELFSIITVSSHYLHHALI